MIKAVIFDMDGLLIDSEKIMYQINQDILKLYGCVFALEDYAENYSGKTAAANMMHLIEQFHLPMSVQEGLKQMETREENYRKQGIALQPGAKELLEYLKKNHYKIALATSSTKERALEILNNNHIAGYFEDMVFGPEVKRSKPYPDVFLQACEKLKESPKECLVLEDSEAGIQAAHAAEIPVICVPDVKKPGDEFVRLTIDVKNSLYEVIDFLKGFSLD